MSPESNAEKVLKELNYDFSTFNLDAFMKFVGERRGREVIPIPWEGMPLGLFGAWLEDREKPVVYLFYRNNAPLIQQIHIQLHELAHFLLGHPALDITQETLLEIINGAAPLPYENVPQMRSQFKAPTESEAETLANLIQRRVIQDAGIAQLTGHLSSGQKFANFVKTLRLK